jgi:hypothetical protein
MAKIHFSPLTAVAVGPAGPPSKLAVSPHSGPSTAIAVTASSVVGESDFQWVQLGLTVPGGLKIKGVVVCYQIIGSREGTYISQTRLTEMTTPNVAVVRHDDPTNLTSPAPVCYQSKVSPVFAVNGTITLELKMVIAKATDKILVGGISLLS